MFTLEILTVSNVVPAKQVNIQQQNILPAVEIRKLASDTT